jgi:hypothetical protein
MTSQQPRGKEGALVIQGCDEGLGAITISVAAEGPIASAFYWYVLTLSRLGGRK